MLRKTVFVLLAYVLVSWTLFAGGGAQRSTSSGQPSVYNMRYSWWGTDTRHNATISAIEAYQALNPNVKIEPEYGAFDAMLEKLRIQLSSKTAPDIISVDIKWVFDMIRDYRANYVNIKNTSINMSDFDPDFVSKTCGIPDFTLGVPTSITYQFMAFNPEFFEKYGLTSMGDISNWDWEDYINAGTKVQSQNKDAHLLYTMAHNWPYYLKAYYKQLSGKDIIDADYTVNITLDDATKFFEYLLRMFRSGTIATLEELAPFAVQYAYNHPGWLEGKFGMAVQAASHLPSFEANSPFTVGAAMPMVVKGAVDTGWPVSTSMILCVNADGVSPAEAAKFIDWHLNNEQAIEILRDVRGLPASKKAQILLAEKGIIMPQFVEADNLFFAANNKIKQGQVSAENGSVIDTVINDLIWEFVQEVGYGRLSPQDGARAFMNELNRFCQGKK